MQKRSWLAIGIGIVIVGFIGVLYKGVLYQKSVELNQLEQRQQLAENQLIDVNKKLEQVSTQYQILQNSNPIQLTKQFKDSIGTYEKIVDLQKSGAKTQPLEVLWAEVMADIANNNTSSASADLNKLQTAVSQTETALVSTPPPTQLPVSNSPPGSGFSQQVVTIDSGSFVVSIVSADLKTSKLIVDTASEHDCGNNCPVNSLDFYARRSGAFAGVNGPYFCPDTYPTCADKKNSFDTLLMNKNKVYFNSDNNVYSTNPVAIFSTSSRFEEKGQAWGRDTSVDSVIMGRPLLVFNNSVWFNGNSDSKETSKGNRAFVGATDGTVYIGIVHSATVAQVAQVLAKLGIRNAINLDSGGSAAMWVNGKYIIGPGRNLPFGVLLVKR